MTTTTCSKCGTQLVATPEVHRFEGRFEWTTFNWRTADGGWRCTESAHGFHDSMTPLPERIVTFNGPTKVYSVPAKFFNDHEARELPIGRVIREGKRTVTVEMDDDLWGELRSDADYYSDASDFDDDPFMRALCRSAQTTVRSLDRQGAPTD